jgi:Flp pilus assembly protein TadG
LPEGPGLEPVPPHRLPLLLRHVWLTIALGVFVLLSLVGGIFSLAVVVNTENDVANAQTRLGVATSELVTLAKEIKGTLTAQGKTDQLASSNHTATLAVLVALEKQLQREEADVHAILVGGRTSAAINAKSAKAAAAAGCAIVTHVEDQLDVMARALGVKILPAVTFCPKPSD